MKTQKTRFLNEHTTPVFHLYSLMHCSGKQITIVNFPILYLIVSKNGYETLNYRNYIPNNAIYKSLKYSRFCLYIITEYCIIYKYTTPDT